MKNRFVSLFAVAATAASGWFCNSALGATPLRVGYSDWPGWVAWEIALEKGWFQEEGVDVEFLWMDYVASMDGYVAGNLDAVCMTNGDALVTGATGKPSIAIIINDYSNGNDMLIARPGIATVADLKGKKLGLEEGFVSHLFAIKALEAHGLSAADVEIVNTPTNETPQVLASGAVDAISAWQPSSGQALKTVAGSSALVTSKDLPGIIYDLLYVSAESLEERRADWAKVVKVWYRVIDFIGDEAHFDEALEILAKRVSLKPEEYEPFFDGTYLLSLDEAVAAFEVTPELSSIYGSSELVNAFNVEYGVYESLVDVAKYIDGSLTREYAASLK
jgi:NitT/TauT family transport system substrate-binding protein